MITRVSWKNTDNWRNHPLFAELARDAISSDSDHDNKRFFIKIERSAYDTIVSRFLERQLMIFEEECTERGENLRASLSEEFEAALREEMPAYQTAGHL